MLTCSGLSTSGWILNGLQVQLSVWEMEKTKTRRGNVVQDYPCTKLHYFLSSWRFFPLPSPLHLAPLPWLFVGITYLCSVFACYGGLVSLLTLHLLGGITGWPSWWCFSSPAPSHYWCLCINPSQCWLNFSCTTALPLCKPYMALEGGGWVTWYSLEWG